MQLLCAPRKDVQPPKKPGELIALPTPAVILILRLCPCPCAWAEAPITKAQRAYRSTDPSGHLTKIYTRTLI